MTRGVSCSPEQAMHSESQFCGQHACAIEIMAPAERLGMGQAA